MFEQVARIFTYSGSAFLFSMAVYRVWSHELKGLRAVFRMTLIFFLFERVCALILEPFLSKPQYCIE